MNLLKCFLVIVYLSSIMLLSSCEDEPDTAVVKNGLTVGADKNLKLNFSHSFGNAELKLSPQEYITANDTIRLTELRYYVSNITLTNEVGVAINLGNYNLIDFDSINTKTVVLLTNVPTGNYKKLSFFIGVDSIRNSSGAQEGALDPNLGMFWTWNTGYIFFKARGRYSANSSFALDIGGSNNLTSISFDLSNIANVNSASPEVAIQLDIQNLFNAPNSYNLGVDAAQIHNSSNGSIPKLKSNIANAFALKGIK